MSFRLAARHKWTLKECRDYTDRDRPYIWAPRSMEDLAELGFVEPTTPPRNLSCKAWKITEHGRSYLEGLKV